MGWLQDYNGAETSWVHVVLLILMLGGGMFVFWFFGPESKEIVEMPIED